MIALAVLVTLSATTVMAAPQAILPSNNQPMPNMFTALNVDSMIKTFDPKFVVVQDQKGEMPDGVHDALVKSLISDLHAVDVPVVYAQKRDMPMQ